MNAVAAEFKLIRQFMNDVIAAGATVFGGAVRDVILANAKEVEFYAAGGKVDEFFDKTVLSHTNDRMLIPTDVDAFICEDDFESIHQVWNRLQMLSSRRISIGNLYLKMSNSTTHFKYTFGLARNDLFERDLLMSAVHPHLHALLGGTVTRFADEMRSLTEGCRRQFTMDLLVVQRCEMKNPFQNQPDFDVNGLFMDIRGVFASPAVCSISSPMVRYTRMQEIVKNIEMRQANFLGWSDSSNWRMIHMLRKGWTVPFTLVTDVTEKYEGHCLVCHDQVPEKHVKLPCCDARYHLDCLIGASKQMIKRAKCVMCNQSVDRLKLFVDITIIRPSVVANVPNNNDDSNDPFANLPDLVDDNSEEEALLRSLPSLAHLVNLNIS